MAVRSLILITAFLSVQTGVHFPLISLPYFWDEAGYYVPAAADFLERGRLIPVSVPSNAHPPLLSIYISAWWKVCGQTIASSRAGMLFLSTLGLWAVYRLGAALHSARTGMLAAVCTAAYPGYFTQSSMVLADLPSAVFCLLGLEQYLANRRRAGFLFTAAVLFKETAILAPLALLAVDLYCRAANWRRHAFWTLPAVIALCAWYLYHWSVTGFIFGNLEFFRYNVVANFDIVRFVFALVVRCWQAFGHLGMLVFAIALCAAAIKRRISPSFALVRICAIVACFVIAMSILGGALLNRYLLPVVPMIIIAGLMFVRRQAVLAISALGLFIASLSADMPYPRPAEENLAYRDFVLAHQDAARELERNFSHARIATSWPATDELSKPLLGYVTAPLPVVRIQRVSAASLRRLSADQFDAVLTFNRGDTRWPVWRRITLWFGEQEEETPDALIQALPLRLVKTWRRGAYYAALLAPEDQPRAGRVSANNSRDGTAADSRSAQPDLSTARNSEATSNGRPSDLRQSRK